MGSGSQSWEDGRCCLRAACIGTFSFTVILNICYMTGRRQSFDPLLVRWRCNPLSAAETRRAIIAGIRTNRVKITNKTTVLKRAEDDEEL